MKSSLPIKDVCARECMRPNSYYLGSAESPTSDSFSVWLKSSRSGDVASPPCSPQVGICSQTAQLIWTTGPVSAVRTSAGASTRRMESLPGAGRKIPTHQPMRDISLGADALRQTLRRADHLCRRGTVQAHHCRPEDHRSCRLPGEARVCSSPGETTGQGRLPHQSWDLGWRRFRA